MAMINYLIRETELEQYLAQFVESKVAKNDPDNVKRELKVLLATQLDSILTDKVLEFLSPEEATALGSLVGNKEPASVVQRFLLEKIPGIIDEVQSELVKFQEYYLAKN